MLGVAGSAQRAADLKDEDRGVEGQVVEPLTDVLRLGVQLGGGVLDAFQDVEADLNRVFARQLLIVLGELLEVCLRSSQGLLGSVLKLSDRALLFFEPDIVRVVRVTLHLKVGRFKLINIKRCGLAVTIINV